MFALFIALECGKTTYKYNIRIKNLIPTTEDETFLC